ncbi:MAG: ankyrin repeat domain-containing protein [Holosporaceae bacterium]|nr:ankyrin repeat domain-containing protein [Holosporaceae bacterium]
MKKNHIGLKVFLTAASVLSTIGASNSLELCKAILCRDIDRAQILINYGADVNEINRYGNSLLHEAIAYGDSCVNMAVLLIMRGACVNVPGSNKDTPLHFAAQLPQSPQNRALIDFLIQNGACVNIRNHSGETPIYSAVFSGNIWAIKLLIKGGANFNIPDNEGITPLGRAILLERDRAILLERDRDGDGDGDGVAAFLIEIGAIFTHYSLE